MLYIYRHIISNTFQKRFFGNRFVRGKNVVYIIHCRLKEKKKKKIAQAQRTICQNRLLVEMRLIMIYGKVLPDERFRCVL